MICIFNILYRYLKKHILFLLLSAFAGMLFGLSVWAVVGWKPSAMTVVEVGRITKGPLMALEKTWLEEMLQITEFLTSGEATVLIAQRTGQSYLASSLLSRRYGGAGDLTVKEMWHMPYVQIRVRANTPKDAVAAASAAAHILIGRHQEKRDKWKAVYDAQLKDAELNYKEAYSALEEWKLSNTKKMSSDQGNTLVEQLLGQNLRKSLMDSVAVARGQVEHLRLELTISDLEKSNLYIPATLDFSLLSSAQIMGIIGSVIGVLLSILYLSTVSEKNLRPDLIN